MRGQAGEQRLRRLAVAHVAGVRHAPALDPLPDRAPAQLLQREQPLRRRDRQRPEQNRVHHAVDDRRRADADRDRQHRDQREAGRPREPRAACRRSRTRSSSQRAPRPSRIASLWRSTPPNATSARRRASRGSIPARTFFSVSSSMWRRNLLVHAGFRAAAREEEAQAGPGGVEPAHGSCSGEGWRSASLRGVRRVTVATTPRQRVARRGASPTTGVSGPLRRPDLAGAPHVVRNTVSSAAAKRRQLSISSPSTRRPAAVIR